MQAVNIGYSPRHAAPPSAKPPKLNSPRPRRRLAAALAAVFALLAGGAGVTLLPHLRPRSAGCHGSLGCAGPGAAADRSLTVRIDSAVSFGLHEPASIAICSDHLWVTNQASDSVTEFGWRADSVPVIWSGRRHELAAPDAVTAGRDRLWIAGLSAITEMNAINGRVIRVIAQPPGSGSPRALTLYGSRLWVAGADSVAEFSTRSGHMIEDFRARRYGFSDTRAIAVSQHKLWVLNAGNGSLTEMDASSGRLVGRIAGAALGQAEPVATSADRTRLWVAGLAPAGISEIDTATGRLVTRLTGPRYAIAGPTALTLSSGKVWVTNVGNDSVTEINARTGAAIGVLRGARYGFSAPTGVIAYRGRVWVVNHATSTVTELIPRGQR